MKKSLNIFFINICLLSALTTKCFAQNEAIKVPKEVNYIPYFLEVQKAKRLSNEGKLKESFNKLDSLFDFYEPKESLLINESTLYCKLSDTFKIYKKERIRGIIVSLVSNYGRNLVDNDAKWKRIILRSGLKKSDITEMYSKLQSNIDTAIRDTIGVMYERDQWARATQERIDTKLDSIDKLNEPIIVDILKKYGYPNEKLVGMKNFENPARDPNISALLMHLDPKLKIEILEPMLLEEIKKGDFSPFLYAQILDHIKIISHVESPLPYYGSYVTNKSIQTIENLEEINKNRQSIGLLGLKK